MQTEIVRSETSTQEIDLGDIFEVQQLAKRASSSSSRTPSSIPPPLPAAKPKARPGTPAARKSGPLPSFDDCADVADVERVVLTRESASKLPVAEPVELPTLRSLKAITKWRAITTLASETLRVPHMSLAQATSALRRDPSDLAKTRIHIPSRARAIVAQLRAVPAPILASAAAFAAVLVIGIGVLASVGRAAPTEARVQQMPLQMLTPAQAMAPSLHASESTARWADVPAIIDVPAPLEPQPETAQQ
jgi:hypothetical protein